MDPEPKLTAALDQAGAALRSLATPLREFFDALKKEGFSEQQAMEFTHSAFDTILSKAFNG